MANPRNNHYTYCREELPDLSYVYQFTTNDKLGYKVYFDISEYDDWLTEFPSLFANGYAFGFFRVAFNEELKPSLDNGVFCTICRIIEDFIALKGTDVVLLYHCDASDSRQAARYRLFQLWYNRQKPFQRLIKKDLEVLLLSEKGVVPYYLGYLAFRNNELLDQLHEEFEQIALQFDGFSMAK